MRTVGLPRSARPGCTEVEAAAAASAEAGRGAPPVPAGCGSRRAGPLVRGWDAARLGREAAGIDHALGEGGIGAQVRRELGRGRRPP